MLSYNQTDSFAFYTGTLNGSQSHNGTDYDEDQRWPPSYYYIFPVFIILVCIFGILGNGTVIWLLGFNLKMNHFTCQILDLALTDFILLTATVICIIYFYLQLFLGFSFVFLVFSMFTASQVLRTLITMDRCFSLLFPFWHCSHWAKKFSVLVCVLTWVVSFLSPAIDFALSTGFISNSSYIILYQYIVTTLFCFTLMAISSLMLFIKLCGKSKKQRRQKIVIIISVIAFFFFFLCLPVNIFSMICLFHMRYLIIVPSVMLCACFNSSINPFIYYLVGRPKDGCSDKSMKAALQTLIEEEEISVHLLENPAGTPL